MLCNLALLMGEPTAYSLSKRERGVTEGFQLCWPR